MDFNSLGVGGSFYILTQREGQKPTLDIGTVKEKVVQQYNLSVPNAMNGLGTQPLLRFVVTISGNDKVITDVPSSLDIAQKGVETYSCNPQSMIQCVDTMMQKARRELDRADYNKSVLVEGERHMETLNPRYADEKQRDRTIRELVEHRKETDSKLDKIIAFMQELTTPTKK